MKTPWGFLLLSLIVPELLQAGEAVDYVRDIRPIFESRCYACHGALRKKGSLRLDTAALLKQGGDSGEVVVPGNAAESYLVERISAKDGERMPPEDAGEPLEAEQIALINAWIDQGARAPDEVPPVDPRQHWAYAPPVRPRPPQSGWASNPVDAFIAAQHQAHNLTPSPEAPRHILLRRVYLDLVGLPPTAEQLQAFWNDSSAGAYERVVEQLLANPRYGERWGRHWMDVWRYSDWSGFQQQIRNSQRHVWRWRDWIIESLNDDKGYDQMVREMLAGDEIAPTDPDTLRATGYLARSWFKFNRNTWLDGTVEHVAKAFLGMTINCARCHDHKFDPIDQENYYQLRAFFEPHDVRTDRLPGEPDLRKDGLARVVDLKPQTPTYVFARGNDLYPDKNNPLTPRMPAVLGGQLEIAPIELPLEAWYPALRPWVLQEEEAAAQRKLDEAAAELKKSREQLADANADPDRADTVAAAEEAVAMASKKLATVAAERVALLTRIAAERAKYGDAADDEKKRLAEAAGAATQALTGCKADEQHLAAQHRVAAARRALRKGDTKTEQALAEAEKNLAAAENKREDAQAALAKPSSNYEPLGKIYPKTSTGRRLALARWITDRENPLAARVAINHIWLRHMGAPLVDNMFDFGLRCKDVRNASLLDWLAVELMDNGWHMKHIHRLIVTSNTYRMTSKSPLPQIIRSVHYPFRETSPRMIWGKGLGGGAERNKRSESMFNRRSRGNGQLTEALRRAPEAVKHKYSPEAIRFRTAASSNLKKDPNNHYLWRMNSRPLEAESVRDSILHAARNLDQSMGGPEIDQNVGQTSRRRSVYFRHAYEKQMKFLELFDGASVNECYRRSESVVPQQALALANSRLSLEQSRLLAAELWKKVAQEQDAEEKFIRLAFRHVLSRQVTEVDMRDCRRFLQQQTALLTEPAKLTPFSGGAAVRVKPSSDPWLRARENLVHVIYNHNDFVTIR